MHKNNLRYWGCQIGGWGSLGLIVLFLNFVVFNEKLKEIGGEKQIIISLLIFLFTGMFITHAIRFLLTKIEWIKFSINKTILLFVFLVGISGVLLFYITEIVEKKSGYSIDEYLLTQKLNKAKEIEKQLGVENVKYYDNILIIQDSVKRNDLIEMKKNTGWYRDKTGAWARHYKTNVLNIFSNYFLIAIWLLIYMVWHYVARSKKNEINNLKLVTTVKELELKTIKSHINPHFIFNALNSIRALVDENPERARTAITELSNILRSSMQAEKAETVTLEKELDIVKDYLALEQMRFEERLKIEFDIDNNALKKNVPPMMLQTLVENAVKHGISKLLNGGLIKIMAHTNLKNELELLVQNTGQLKSLESESGFGIKSTQDRLNLMYQGKAAFSIYNLNNNIVESKVTLPTEK